RCRLEPEIDWAWVGKDEGYRIGSSRLLTAFCPRRYRSGDDCGSGLRARRRALKSLTDEFQKLLGRRDGTHVDRELIDLAIFVEVHLIDRLKLLPFKLALKAEKVPIVSCISG